MGADVIPFSFGMPQKDQRDAERLLGSIMAEINRTPGGALCRAASEGRVRMIRSVAPLCEKGDFDQAVMDAARCGKTRAVILLAKRYGADIEDPTVAELARSCGHGATARAIEKLRRILAMPQPVKPRGRKKAAPVIPLRPHE